MLRLVIALAIFSLMVGCSEDKSPVEPEDKKPDTTGNGTLSVDTLWTRTYGSNLDDAAYSVQQTTDGGFIITGITNSDGLGGSDVYLIRTDSNGTTLWTRTYGGSDHDIGLSVQQTTDGGFIIAGSTGSYGAGSADVYLIRTDANGDTLWTKTYGGIGYDIGNSVQQTIDRGFIIAGGTMSYVSGPGVFLIRTDADGDTLWTRTYEGWGFSVQQTTDGGYVIVGYTTSYGAAFFDVYLILTDGNGDTLWTRTYGGSNDDVGQSVQQIKDGGFIITGFTNADNIDDDVYLIRTDTNGDTLWTRTYGGGGIDMGSSVQQTTDGGFIIAGSTLSFGAGKGDVYLIRIDSNGDTLWTRTYGGIEDESGSSVQQTTDGGFIIAGNTESYGVGDFDVYLIRLKEE